MEMNLKRVGKNIFLKNNIKILIVGSGNQAENYLKVFSKHKISIHTICVTKRSKKKAIKLQKKYKIQNIGYDINKIIKENKFNFIFLLITWDKIQNYILKIIKNIDCPIFAEKPIALSYNKLNKINKISSILNKKIYVLYNRRFFETVNILRKKVKSSKQYKFSVNIPEQNQRIINKYGKNIKKKIKYFISSHWLDLIFYICGNMKILKIFVNQSIASIILKNNKCIGTVNFYFNTIDKIRFNFYTSKLNLELNPLEKLYITSNIRKDKNNYLLNKKLIKDISSQHLKPGIENIIKSIFFKKNYRNFLPTVTDLKPNYKVLEKLNH